MHAPVLINSRDGAIRIGRGPTGGAGSRRPDPLLGKLRTAMGRADRPSSPAFRPSRSTSTDTERDSAGTATARSALPMRRPPSGTAVPAGEPFHLVGHSYGGAVALRFALSFPERLRSLTLDRAELFHLLVDEIGKPRTGARPRSGPWREAINCAVLCGDYRGGMETFIDYWGGAGTWKRMPEERKAQFANLAVRVAHHFCSLFGEDDPAPGLHATSPFRRSSCAARTLPVPRS